MPICKENWMSTTQGKKLALKKRQAVDHYHGWKKKVKKRTNFVKQGEILDQFGIFEIPPALMARGKWTKEG